MKADIIELMRFISMDNRTFKIPVYQRNYSWQDEDCKILFEDIKATIANKNYKHFLGSVVYVDGINESNKKEELIIIDGQQRLTSVMLLLKAIYDKVNDKIKERIYNKFLTNEYSEDENKFKLNPMKSDENAYLALMTNDSNSIDDELKDTNMYKNYECFELLLKQDEDNYSIEEIFDALFNLNIVYMHLDKVEENPQAIFENLNSKGRSLRDSDLIRNYLLMQMDYKQQIEFYEKYWVKIEKRLLTDLNITTFIRDFIVMQEGFKVNDGSVYKEFKNYARTKEVKDVLEDLLVYSEYYSWFLSNDNKSNIKYEECNKDSVRQLLNQTKLLGDSSTRPLMLFLFENLYYRDCFELEEILKHLISYILRLKMNGKKCQVTNFIPLLGKGKYLKINKPEDFHEVIFKYLINSKSKTAKYPFNDEFKTNFLNRSIYSKKNLDRYILIEIEKFNNKEFINFDDAQIEHIMPQKLSLPWRNMLGKLADDVNKSYGNTLCNLTLTKYNQTLSNKGFEEKKLSYKNSNIRITRDLINYSEWNEKEIKKRGTDLFEVALQIWDIPLEYYDDNIKNNIKEGDVIITDIDIDLTSTIPKTLTIEDKIIRVSNWKQLFLTLLQNLYDLDKDKFINLKDDNELKKIIFTSEPVRYKNGIEEVKRNAKIGELFILTCHTANRILELSRIFCEKFEIEAEVYYSYENR